MTVRKTYYPFEGDLSISDSSLAYVKILMVTRSGLQFNVIPYTSSFPPPDERTCLYNNSDGSIVFVINFNSNESINVIYETNP